MKKLLAITALALLLSAHALAADSDGDGVDDAVDQFPSDFCRSLDTDGDGKPNSLHCFYENFDGQHAGPAYVDPTTPGSFPGYECVVYPTTGGLSNSRYARFQYQSIYYWNSCMGGGWIQLIIELPAPQTLTYYYRGEVRVATTPGSNTLLPNVTNWTQRSINLSAGKNTITWRGDYYPYYPSIDQIQLGPVTSSSLVQDEDDDNDGVADVTDKFPLNPAASSDSDNDGFPSSWNAACDATCQANSGLILDNCKLTSNPTQANFDGDGEGDVCDDDDDNDGVPDTGDVYPFDSLQAGDKDGDGVDGFVDNCPANANADQLNTDGDAEGNVCDSDDDNDGVSDGSDDFPSDPTEVTDTDNDGVGNNADADDDNDGVSDGSDNCPLNANPDQADTDGDGLIDVCGDSDDDNDGVSDSSDKFPINAAASSDSDNDGFPGNWNASCDATCQANSGLILDNCPTTSNPTQANFDGDAQGDACDSDDDNDDVLDTGDEYPLDPAQAGDIDGDGVDGFTDNCPAVSNADQLDTDADGYGDACDNPYDADNDGILDGTDKFPLNFSASVDSDNDGYPDSWNGSCNATCQTNSGLVIDNCPVNANTSQNNFDGDGLGDACDMDDDNDGVLDAGDEYPFDSAQAGDVDSDGIDGFIDNCPTNSNTDQLNTDSDINGNACDSDDDNDGVSDSSDKFPLSSSASSDSDNDGFPGSWNAACDVTCQANSGLLLDNCPSVFQDNLLDTDSDGLGDICDPNKDNDIASDSDDKFPLNPAASSDSDNDGFPDIWDPACDLACQQNSGLAIDNCPTTANPTQVNFDGDAQGDVCDADDDNDGMFDNNDVFPFNPAEWLDSDNDGIGNNAEIDDDNDGVVDASDPFPLDGNRWQRVRHNSDNDNDSDVLIRSSSTGVWTRYAVQNGTISGNNVLSGAATSSGWQYVAQLDADGDGDADILTRFTSNGLWGLYRVQNGVIVGSESIPLYANLDYKFVGAGDFNGDGADDVMLRHPTQGYRVFLLGSYWGSVVLYNAWISASSVDQGIGDFNGDGTDDLLVRRTSDNLYFIFKTINGAVSNYYCACNIWANPDWTFQFAGDTNKDGIDDVIIRGTGPSADGKWWAFRMNNFSSVLTTNLNLFLNKTAITVGAVGDYNGDGNIDVLTRVNNSTTYVSPIVNGAVTGNYWLYNFTTDQVIGK